MKLYNAIDIANNQLVSSRIVAVHSAAFLYLILKKKHRSEIFNEYFRLYVHDTQPAIKTWKKFSSFFKLIF